MADFTPFPAPVHIGDVQLVRAVGPDYICGGCGGKVPDGALLYEQVETGEGDDPDMVVGLIARHAPNGPPVHACGSAAQG